MAKSTLNPVWKKEPDKHDYPAAANYLSLIADEAVVADLVARLKKAPVTMHQAKDLLRAAQLVLLPSSDKHVAADLNKIVNGTKLSPVLLVRGGIEQGLPLTIADGYHRVCASYYTADDANIPARLVDLTVPSKLLSKK